jgi:hypothetical protein
MIINTILYLRTTRMLRKINKTSENSAIIFPHVGRNIYFLNGWRKVGETFFQCVKFIFLTTNELVDAE